MILKLFILMMSFGLTLGWSATKEEIFAAYKKEDFSKACKMAVDSESKYPNDPKFYSLYGFSCLKADQLFRLDTAIKKLVQDKEARANALYFATVQYQKKILYNALVDGLDITGVNLPKTEYILSTIATKYVKKEYTRKGEIYHFKDKDLTHELSVIDKKTTPKLLLITKKEDKTVIERKFW